MDRSEIIARMEVGLESQHSKTDDVEPGLPRKDDAGKVNKLFHHEVCEMRAICFLELCLPQLRIAWVARFWLHVQ